ncbi:Niemann-Pick C1 protein-like isoform X2 [Zootermopsis nevadensis]
MKDYEFQDSCIYQSVLRIWTSNGTMDTVFKLDQEAIMRNITHAINVTETSHGKFSNVLERVEPLLSGIRWDNQGNVIGAKATILNWILKKTNKWSPDWELEFIQNVLFSNRTLPPGMKIYAVSTRSYLDFLQQVLQNNQTVLFAGFTLIIVYVMVMLGRFNSVEQRVYLSLLGVSVVGQSILASYGLCFYMGFFWGPIHPILPFLLLGVGVDNSFVIMQYLDNLNKEDKVTSVPERLGQTLRQAGVSITVTSLTDIFAFAIGTSTIMPFLRSFCVFAATGIFFLYVFEILFFVSCLAIDEMRLQKNRDGCICVVHRNWKPNECSQQNIQKMVFKKYVGPTLMKTPVKVCIIIGTLLLFGLNVWFVLKVEQKFDPMWYLNSESYPIQYNNKLNEHFPEYGKRAGIYLGSEINYFRDKDKLYELYTRLENNPYINKGTLDFWYIKFQNWLSEEIATESLPSDEDEMKSYISEFLLMSQNGQKYIKDVKFSAFPFGDYNITASQIPIQHILMNTTTQQVKAMESVREIIKSVNFSVESIVSYSPEYVSWTANKIIGDELLRNLGLTICAVAAVTLILIQNLQTSFWVICCVVFTVVDLVGSMYWLGLTIEISTSIMILLCAGLAVDYSAHIGNEFMHLQGTRHEKAIKTLVMIGSAVLNGGLSTFLAFVLLGGSDSYLFTTFFKLFTGVVVFGLFHALVFLPVALSWFGPLAQKNVEKETSQHFTVPVESKNGYYQSNNITKEDVSTSKYSLKALEDGGINQLSSLIIKTHPCNLSDSGYNSKSPSGSSEGS